MVSEMDGGEDYFCIDSKPIEVCRIARSKRCSMGKKDYKKAPGVGYCASQSMYYYGYKLHAVCGLSGVIHSFDLMPSSGIMVSFRISDFTSAFDLSIAVVVNTSSSEQA